MKINIPSGERAERASRRGPTHLRGGVGHRGPERAGPEYDDFLPVLAIAHQGDVAREVNAEGGALALLRQVFPSAAACCARTSKGGNEDERRHRDRDVSERTLTRSQAGHGTTQPRRGEVEINVYTHHFVAALDLSNAEDVLQQTSRSRSLLRRLGLTTTAALLHLCSYSSNYYVRNRFPAAYYMTAIRHNQ